MQFDDVLSQSGSLDRFQLRMLVLCSFTTTFVGWQNFIPIFTIARPDFRCSLPELDTNARNVSDRRQHALVNATHSPKEDAKEDECRVEVPALSNRTDTVTAPATEANGTQFIKCTRWVYDKSVFQTTITEDLDIVCDRAIYRTHSYMAMFVGKFFAALCQGTLSDIFGRKRLYLASAILIILSSFAGGFVVNVPTMILTRFLAAFSATATYLSAFVLGIEFMGPSRRKLQGIVTRAVYVTSILSLAPIAYLLPNWRHLTFALAAPSLLLLPAWWFIPESPRWLLAKGRREEAVKVMKSICAINKTRVPEVLLDEGEGQGQSQATSSKPLELFKSAPICARYFIVYFNWAVVSMTYYGLAINVTNLTGDLYVNFALSAAVEYVSLVTGHVTLDRLGRKRMYCASMILAGLALLGNLVPVLMDTTVSPSVQITLYLVGKMGVAGGFTVIYIFTAELWPTVLRNFGLGSSSTSARVGAMICPYIVDVGLLMGGTMGKGLPLLLFGALALGAGLSALALPETVNRRLPDTIDDVKAFGRTSSKAKTEAATEMTNRL